MIRRTDGFSLLELMMVVAVIGILSHMGFVAYTDMMCRSGDVAAISDSRNLMTVATEQFITGSYPDFTHSPGMGHSVGLKSDGTYTFTLSTGVSAQIFGKPAAAGEGYMEAFVYHQRGSSDPTNMYGRRIFYCVVDEKNSTIIGPQF
ncbi:MAG: prepilin-type N-terminal cleavage/methylation domain-containing protein [Thermodesulfobacteriota bacterium]|nr:prepilin-type N-terminal cleavage/methylation domain-containing protein [Thermodesulfobacteriota bacterium]